MPLSRPRHLWAPLVLPIGRVRIRRCGRCATGSQWEPPVCVPSLASHDLCGLRYRDNGHRDWHGAQTRNDLMHRQYLSSTCRAVATLNFSV